MHVFRSGQTRHILLYMLLPVVMLAGMMLVNTISKSEMKAFATMQGAAADVVRLCVIEDLQKFCLVIMGAVAGTVIGLLFRIEADTEFAKRNYTRRIGYMTVAMLTSSCATPYILMKISDDQTKPLCLLMGAGVSFFAWVLLEAFYSRAKSLITWLFDKLPLPKVPDAPDTKPPAH